MDTASRYRILLFIYELTHDVSAKGYDVRRSNWHRWGDEDQRGAANTVGTVDIMSALKTPSTGEVVPLGLPVRQREVPVLGGRAPIVHSMRVDAGDYVLRDGAERPAKGADDYVFMGCHSGTHIDGLAHVWEGSELYNGYSQAFVRSTGAHRLGIEQLGYLVTRGVLLDAASVLGEPVPPGYSITADDIHRILAEQGVELRRGDVVFVRTGWLERWLSSRSERDELLGLQQGLSKDTIDIWADADVAGLGADNFAVEVWPDHDGEEMPLHRRAIRDLGMYLIELAILDELAAKLRDANRSHFLFVAAPLRIKGGTGSPLNPLAIL